MNGLATDTPAAPSGQTGSPLAASAPVAGRLLTIDEGFPRRVVRTSLIVTAMGVLYACLGGAWRAAIGLGAGGVIGCAAFVVLAWTIGLLLGRSSAPRWRKAGVLALALLKIPVLLAALWFVLYRLDAHPVALLAGLAMTQIVMVLKVGGQLVANQARRPVRSKEGA